MSFIIKVLVAFSVTILILIVGQSILYPIERELHRIADFLESFEVKLEEEDKDVEL